MTEADGASWPAPAKINLFLHVTGRRPDGYHELQTLFQLLDWGDDVFIRPLEGPEIVRSACRYGVAEDEDLVVRAARLLQEEADAALGAEISVTKRIPMGSGMGGGSSDAATVLLVLNRLWKCGFSLDDMAALGGRLGADVPVFIRGQSAMATGTGDRLEAVALGRTHYLLVFPGVSVSTRAVFEDPLLRRDTSPISLTSALTGGGRNDCETVVRRRYPEVAALLDALQEFGAARMTGTGSGIFIPMPGKKQAIRAAEQLKSLYNVRAVGGVDRSPVHGILDGY